jgi:hypothetical protein
MSVSVKLLMRAAVFLAVVAGTYWFVESDAADESDENLGQRGVAEFVRVDNDASDNISHLSDTVDVDTANNDAKVIELHKQSLAALGEERYQDAYQLMQQLYQLRPTPDHTVAVNASRVAGHWANELHNLYEHDQARKVWRQAIEWHHDSGHPQLSLARLLLRTAEVDAARKIVESALLEFPQNAQLLVLRGEIASMLGDSELAVEMMLAATVVEPNNPRFVRRLAQLKIEADAFENYLPLSTAHFESSFDAQNRSMVRNIDDLQQDLERAWSDISGLLGIQNDRRIVVLWLDAADYKGQAPDWSSGIYDGRIRIVVDDYPERRPQMLSTLKHELTHALLHSTGIQFPTFIQEGLAQLYEPRNVDAIRESYLGDELPSLIDLQGSWTAWTDTVQVRKAYAYSLSLCDFVRDRYGDDSFGLLFENMRSSGLREAWQATFGNTLQDSDKLHRQFLAHTK